MANIETSRRGLIASGVAAAVIATSQHSSSASEIGDGKMVHQLRVYEIFESNKAAFHVRFRDQCIPIMKRYGFDIAALWEAQGERGPEFVYLLRWRDEATLKASWNAFMADAEWSRIKAETGARQGKMVGAIQSRVMRLTDYSESA